ncbi:MAG: cation:proton antiporter [Candidatus Aenigmatarchaeota archaeon]
MSLLFDIGVIIIIATVLSYFARLFKQPMILAYIVTGILVGPSVFNIISSFDETFVFAELGVAFLLFLVGLNLNFKILKDVGKTSIITGIGQVFFTVAIGYVLSAFFGFGFLESLYISIALAFSSTIIIVKLLSDKNDMDSLYGKISIGFLIIQDIIAIIILLILNSLGTGDIQTLLFTNVINFIILFGVVIIFSKYLLPFLISKTAKNSELLFLSGISWLLVMALLSTYLGFSVEIGALLAGISMAPLPYQYEIGSRLKPLRDFFLIFFFIFLGAQMTFTMVQSLMVPVVILSIFVLLGNPLIVMVLMGAMGYRRRTSLFSGLTVAQISEFSLVMVALGFTLGHIGADIVSMVTMVGIITITISSYMIMYNQRLYDKLSGFLKIFERTKLKEKIENMDKKTYDIILLGYHKMGYNMLRNIKNVDNTLIVDFNPNIIKEAKTKKLDAMYGDVSDTDIVRKLLNFKPKLVVSTIPDYDDNIFIIRKFKENNKNTMIFVTTNSVNHALEMYEKGADYVIVPHILGGEKAHSLLEEFIKKDISDLHKERSLHLKHLQEYTKLGQLHL